jgi:oligopeptide/dipeptide ABC transporter ATP-binding protein
MSSILEFRDTVVTFKSGSGLFSRLGGRDARSFNAVDHVSLNVRKGEILGIVGESGSGKTTICKAALGFHSISGGTITEDGKPVSSNDGSLQMVFQDPLSSLNPRQTIARSLEVPLRLSHASKDKIDHRIDELLGDVGLSSQFRNRYPHELSGGQLQRLAIARALATNPRVLFADEAVSKLDVSVRAQVLNLLKKLRDRYNLTIVFVTHDLHVARFLCDRIAVMYFGKLLELGPTREVYNNPCHPYTTELLGTLNKGRMLQASTRDIFNPLTDDVRACRYLSRCQHVMAECHELHPEQRSCGPDHSVACYLYDHKELVQ